LMALLAGSAYSQSISGQLQIFIASDQQPVGMMMVSIQANNNGGQSLAQFLANILEPANGLADYDQDDDGETLFSAPSMRMMSAAPSPCNQQRPCSDDVRKYCSISSDDEAENSANPFYVRMCLHANPMGKACSLALQETPTVVEACYPDIKKNCENIKAGNSQVHSCLAKHVSSMSQSCTQYFNSIDFPAYNQHKSSDYKSLLDRIAPSNPSAARWLQMKANDASAYHHTVIEPRMERAKEWVVHHKQAVGAGSAILFVWALFALTKQAALLFVQSESEYEEQMNAEGYELMWDEEPEL